MTARYFFDLPVYRVPPARYDAEVVDYANSVVFPAGTLHGDVFRYQARVDRRTYERWLAESQRGYGGCWRYNEIIGYVRLHFLGTQVRGEYFAPDRKRIVKTRNRTMTFRTSKLAPEVEIEAPISSTAIAAAVAQYIAACRCELSQRHIDTELFDVLSPHIDWLAIYERP